MHPIPFLRHLRRDAAYSHVVNRFRELRVILPTFSQLADPARMPPAVREGLLAVSPDAADPRNLFRVHWFNDADRRGISPVPAHLVLPSSLTGVDARIVVALAYRYPMVGSHKVLAAYGCVVPRLVGGHFDPVEQRAVWPSTGNYCRGGVAISRLMGCTGVAILPEGMSRERFDWLERWIDNPEDVITTEGTESNVRAIFDKCHELATDPRNVVFNQFTEFGNYLIHYACTGRALETVADSIRSGDGRARIRAFVAATGSSGTLAAGDYLKERFGSSIVAVEPLECPTMLYNGFGEHNIQGVGDKHIPFIHNVMNTDAVVAVSDRSTDDLNALFNTDEGYRLLTACRGVPSEIAVGLRALGLSAICNVLASIKTAKLLKLGPDDVVMTVATDDASMYASEREQTLRSRFGGQLTRQTAAEIWERHLASVDTEHAVQLSPVDRERIFNLGYYTWVEQEGVLLEDFMMRRDPRFWTELRTLTSVVDELIAELNERTAVSTALPA
jgi:cysteine synthase